MFLSISSVFCFFFYVSFYHQHFFASVFITKTNFFLSCIHHALKIREFLIIYTFCSTALNVGRIFFKWNKCTLHLIALPMKSLHLADLFVH
jgi:hypothetical protein